MSILSPDPAKYPLCAYFLSGYLKANPKDTENFHHEQSPEGFLRYEILYPRCAISFEDDKKKIYGHEEGQRSGEIRRDVNSLELPALIISALEGSLMVSRLLRNDGPRDVDCRHLEEDLETSVRVKESKKRANKR